MINKIMSLSAWNADEVATVPDLPLTVVSKDDRLDITVSVEQDQRSVWIEQENGTLRIHCYGTNDEPVTVELVQGEDAKVIEQ